MLVVGTLAFAYWQLRLAQRLHSATTMLDLRERFYNDRMRLARRELAAWLLKSERGEEIENWEVAIFFEMLGSLTRANVLEPRMVWSAFGTWITSYYHFTVRPTNLIEKWRKEGDDPLVFADFEWLANRMMQLERRMGPGSSHREWRTDDARTILEMEARVGLPEGRLA